MVAFQVGEAELTLDAYNPGRVGKLIIVAELEAAERADGGMSTEIGAARTYEVKKVA